MESNWILQGKGGSSGKSNAGSIQLIDRDGVLDVAGLSDFVKAVGLSEYGLSYAVVSIIGPQSSGKSTLLNHLFGTDLKEMRAEEGRKQTTLGIWMAKSDGIDEPCTIVMDVEGADGNERGQDTKFENQFGLFALAVSDILLINMWWTDIGRRSGASKPLLTIIFQGMARLSKPRGTKLLFVVRDKGEAGWDHSKSSLKDELVQMWNTLFNSGDQNNRSFDEVFDVEFVALPHYLFQKDRFMGEVANLKERLTAPGGLAGNRTGMLPASEFVDTVKDLWTDITLDKHLDLPKHHELMSAYRCGQILEEKSKRFAEHEIWKKIDELVNFNHSQTLEFGREITSLRGQLLSEYTSESISCDENIRNQKKQELDRNISQVAQPVFESMLEQIKSEALADFKEAFEKDLNEKKAFDEAANNCKASSLQKFKKDSAELVKEVSEWNIKEVSMRQKYTERLLQENITAHIDSRRSTYKSPSNGVTFDRVINVVSTILSLWEIFSKITQKHTGSQHQNQRSKDGLIRFARQ